MPSTKTGWENAPNVDAKSGTENGTSTRTMNIGVSEMKVCPYCGKDVGKRIFDTDFETWDEDDYVDKDGKKLYFVDYIVSCPDCKGGFHWVEIFQRVTTIITNADTNEEIEYKEESERNDHGNVL
jgi:ssDNA-binding Zn-finger/Zn-ribbon topoisomerase 1